jgi:hypothetical protein
MVSRILVQLCLFYRTELDVDNALGFGDDNVMTELAGNRRNSIMRWGLGVPTTTRWSAITFF